MIPTHRKSITHFIHSYTVINKCSYLIATPDECKIIVKNLLLSVRRLCYSNHPYQIFGLAFLKSKAFYSE